MTLFYVTLTTKGREIYEIEATDKDDAAENWYVRGELVHSEVDDSEVWDVSGEDD